MIAEPQNCFVFPLVIADFYVKPGLHIIVRASFHLTISMRGQRATGKIQRDSYYHGSCGLSLTGKTSSVFLIFAHRTHQNVKNR